MRVRMIRNFPGMCDAKPLPRIGGEIELTDESAAGLIRIKVAEPVDADQDQDQDQGEAEKPAEPVQKRGPGRPRKTESE
ncbi:hypothetical protein JHN55_22875 [Streptomyces sp. MBT56]|uniref:hypothetical protein n=1 Tax=unclassified Streptomyces TaxID=2593676 RepID=UPI00190B5DF5|nr:MULTISPECIES: hypothetical protein [unclassified Streptomyces]MBK3559316.1 hypothetical protein [Streptomyces sp. MBT56]MBK3601039.1 hypothetical protein [Streptomyces sp. MBT54]MBK3613945.1 hypothetical protein [Streptomyces sp. MBT98]MBK6041990.1 hypothetical protein [Streptomyces sp. MBT55]